MLTKVYKKLISYRDRILQHLFDLCMLEEDIAMRYSPQHSLKRMHPCRGDHPSYEPQMP